jgi:hypothetical protein
MIPNASVAGGRELELEDVFCLMPARKQISGKLWRELRVDEKTHGLGRTNDRMVDVLRGVFERGRDVVVLQVRVVLQNIRAASAGRKQIQNILYPNSQSTDARTAAQHLRVSCNSVETSGHERLKLR